MGLGGAVRPAAECASRSPKDWYALSPSAVVAEGVLHRLVSSSLHVHGEGKSNRRRRRPGQGEELANGGPAEQKKLTRPVGELFDARGGELLDVRQSLVMPRP